MRRGWRNLLRSCSGFPTAGSNDQVDALSQLLGWVRQSDAVNDLPLVGPITYWTDDYGVTHSSEDEDFDEGDYQQDGPWTV